MNIKKLDCYIKNYLLTHKQYRDEGCDGDPFHVENVDQLIKE